MLACRRTRSREAHSRPGRSSRGPDTAPEAASLLARARRSPRLGVILVAAAAFAVEMAVSARYGYHRDELYFLEAGRHPAFGYVDQPPLTPLAARLAALLFANSLVGLRVLPALGLSALVLLTAGMSRILGAGRAGQLLAAVCVAGCAEYLGCMHLLTTTTPDFVAWGDPAVPGAPAAGQRRAPLVAGHRAVRRGRGRGQVDDLVPGRGGAGRLRASPRSGGCCAAGTCCWARSSRWRWPPRT